jgi:hypothetical protein
MSGIVGDNIDDGSGVVKASAGGATISSSDPAVDTNPADGVGTQWANSTSGEYFVCTDATAGSNVWTNVGAGTGDIQPFHGWGVSFGFSSTGGIAGTNHNQIDKFSFTSSDDATDVGDVTESRREAGGAFSTTHGYTHGGYGLSNVIDKYAYASVADATDVGNISGNRTVGFGVSSTTYGYSFGGEPSTNIIEKYSFASDGNATDVGDLTAASRINRPGGNQSSTHGYCCGGGSSNVIDKWTFVSDANATDVGNLTVYGYQFGSNSSSTYGYTTGGSRGDEIDKFSFTSDGDATDVGDLLSSSGSNGKFGQNSQTYAYACGGSNDGGLDTIEKYSFASDGNSVDANQNLTQARGTGGSAQV